MINLSKNLILETEREPYTAEVPEVPFCAF